MRSPKIIYLITRTHGLKEHLLKSEDFFRILRAKNIVEIYDLLSNSDYSIELSKIPIIDFDVYQLEKIFYQKLSQRSSFLLQITSGKTREVLEDYYRKIEIENIKRITRATHANEKISEDQLIPIPRKYQTVNFPALLESQNIREMIDLLKESPYRDLRERVDLYEKYNNPLILEAQIDKIYYESLWEKLEEIVDKDEVKDLIGTEIDLKNLLYVLSLKHMKIERELLQEIIINIHYKLSGSLIQQLVDAPYETIPELLTWPSYVELAKKAVELIGREMVTEAENIFSQHFYSYAETVALRNPNNLVYIFAYLHLCFREARNLTTLTIGKHLKIDEEKIRSSLSL